MRGRLVVATAFFALWGQAALGGADLIITAVDGPNTADPGDAITVANTVRNDSAAAIAETFRVGIYLSTDETIDPLVDALIGSRTVAGLTANTDDAASDTPATIPLGTAGGKYFIGAYADDEVPDKVKEPGVEDNNGLADTGGITISGPAPDLVITNVSAPNVRVDPGEPITVEITVKNQGDLAADEFEVGIYLSVDETIDPAEDTHLDGWLVAGGLASGEESSSGDLTVNIPGATVIGVYYIGAYADDEPQAVVESNEENNARADTDGIGVGVAAPSPEEDTPFGGGCSSGAGAGLIIPLVLFFAWRRRRDG